MEKPSVFRPTIPPLLIVIADSALLIAGSSIPHWLLGIVLGAALTWLVIGGISARGNVVRRWPNLRDWFPFLDPSGGLATEAELRSQVVEGKSFRIAMITEHNRIDDRTFHNCVIYGPAVIAASGYTDTKHCVYTAPPEQMYVMMSEDKKARAGFLVAHDCEFKHCRFIGISFVGNANDIEKMKKLPGATEPPDD